MISASTSFDLFESTPSRPAAKTNSFWSASRPVRGEGDLPSFVLSRTFLRGEAELSNRILDIKYVSSS